MLVTCPNCAVGYEVPEHLLGAAGRKLRCARCATNFIASAPPGMAVPEPSPIVEPPPPLRAPSVAEKPPASQAPPAKPRRARATLQLTCAAIAWIASLGCAGGLSFAAIAQRAVVMHAWAPSVRAYRALGLAETRLVSAGSAAMLKAAPAETATSPPTSPPG